MTTIVEAYRAAGRRGAAPMTAEQACAELYAARQARKEASRALGIALCEYERKQCAPYNDPGYIAAVEAVPPARSEFRAANERHRVALRRVLAIGKRQHP